MGKRTITVLAVLALVVACVQETPLGFLPHSGDAFLWGLTGGFSIGALVSWIAEGSVGRAHDLG